MLLLIEIGLAIFASRRGWKGWAALPLAMGMLIGLGIGLGGAFSGMDQMSVLMMALSVDAVAIVTLGIMCAVKGPYSPQAEQPTAKSMAGMQPAVRPVDGYKMVSRQSS